MSEHSTVGKPLPTRDAVGKATGQTVFTADVRLPRALCGKILFSRFPHARILRVDTSRAEALPGVRAVVTARDCPDRYFGLAPDRWVLAREEVRFAGDRVAAVAADDADTAEQALALIDVQYEELPAVLDPIEALRPDAPIARNDRAWALRESHPELGPNAVDHDQVAYGDVGRAFAESDLIVEEEYRTQRVQHSYLEPKAAVALVDPAGEITVWTSTQGHHDCRAQISGSLDIPLSRIKVIAMPVGGGFGGKGEAFAETVAVLLTLKARRPVRVVYSRRDELAATQGRAPAVIRIRSGVTRDGRILAREMHAVCDVGCSHDRMAPSLSEGGVARGPYRIPNLRATWTHVYTNQMPAAPFRAPRAPQACFATESHMDSIARRLGRDPIEIRRINAPALDDEDRSDFDETLARAAERADWDRRERGADEQGRLIGWGLACAYWDTYTSSNSSAIVGINEDGSVVVNTGSVDISGSHTSLAQIAAERLRVDVDRVVVACGDTNVSPWAESTGGSRTVFATGTSVLTAATDAVGQLLEAYSEAIGAPAGELELHDGGIRDRTGMRWRSYGDLVRLRMGMGGGPVIGRGAQSALPGARVHVVQIAQVAVDPETGATSLRRLIAAQSVGQAINPLSVEGQMAGAASQGVGYALLEDQQTRDGYVLNASLVDYRLPTTLDLPAIETIVVAGRPSEGPYGARGVGEPSVIPTAAAIANAVYDALGVRLWRLPLTPEAVFMAIRAADASG